MKLRVGAFAALLVLPCAAQSELTATCLKLEDGTGAQQTICGDNLKVQQSVDESYSIFDKISGLATCLSSEINSTPGTRTINGVAFTSATSLFCHSPSLSVCNKNTYGDCMAKVVVDVSSLQAKCPGNLVFSAWAGIRACPGSQGAEFTVFEGVWSSDVRLYQHLQLEGSAYPPDRVVAVISKSATSITLAADSHEDSNCDHTEWVDPVIRCSADSVAQAVSNDMFLRQTQNLAGPALVPKRFQDYVKRYESPNFSYPGKYEILWNNECANPADNPCLHFNDVGNSEAANYVIFHMSTPVAIKSFAAQTRTHPGASYFGNSKLYGSLDGSNWVEMAALTGEGICVVLGPVHIWDRTPYPFFKLTMFGANRGTYESASHIIIDLA